MINRSALDKIVARWDRLSSRERHQLVQRFRDKINQLNEVLNALNDGVIIFDHAGVASFVNHAAARIYGREVREMMEISFEVMVGHTCSWQDLSTSGCAITRDLQVHYPEPKNYRFFMTPLGEEQGVGREYLLIIHDETEKIAEGEQEAEAEQMNLLSFLASGVAHELGNPVNSLGLNLQLIQRKLSNLAEVPQLSTVNSLVESSLSEVKRLDTLIKQFLQSMRPSTLQRSKVDINQIVRRVLDLLEPEIAARGVSVQEGFMEVLPELDADEGQLFQVFYNLIRNAYQSITGREGGIFIYTSCSDTDVIVQIGDTGCGISHEVLGSIYEPFRTTKKTGTGLGLLIARRIVKEHGGSMGIASREGEGTTVSIQLPRAERVIRLLPGMTP